MKVSGDEARKYFRYSILNIKLWWQQIWSVGVEFNAREVERKPIKEDVV